jgi:hypothetical protein
MGGPGISKSRPGTPFSSDQAFSQNQFQLGGQLERTWSSGKRLHREITHSFQGNPVNGNVCQGNENEL